MCVTSASISSLDRLFLKQPIQLRTELLSNPSNASSVTVEKYAALAMPICSLASATRRSAAQMSGPAALQPPADLLVSPSLC
jgi:hypothetical protein